jgi:HAMP domain-containing protein
VRLECVRTVTRLASAHVQGHAYLRLSILPDPPRGHPHPDVPPPLDWRRDVLRVGQLTQESSFHTRCVRHAMRDASALVRRAAVLEAKQLAQAQGTCGRWYGSDARMLLSDRCERVRRAAVEALVTHCTFFRLHCAKETVEGKGQDEGGEEVGAWDLESALALQGPGVEFGRGSSVQVEFGAQFVTAYDANRGLEGGARLMLTVRRYRGPAVAPPPPNTDPNHSEVPQSDSDEEEAEQQHHASKASGGFASEGLRGEGGGAQRGVDSEDKGPVKTHTCPPPPLEHEWHPPLMWHWEELFSSEAQRHEAGVCVWEAMEVEVETLLRYGKDATHFVKIWELHGKGSGTEAALKCGEVVGSIQLSAGRLLEVGRVPIMPCGTRVALELRGMELMTKIPAVDTSPLQPLLTVKTTSGRLVHAAQGRFISPSEPAIDDAALAGIPEGDDANGKSGDDSDEEEDLEASIEARKAAEAARARKRAAQEGWYEWTPMSLSAESCGEAAPWQTRPASVHSIINMGAAWKLEVWDRDSGGLHRQLGSASLSLSDLVSYLEKLKEARAALAKKALIAARQMAAIKAKAASLGEDGEKGGEDGAEREDTQLPDEELFVQLRNEEGAPVGNVLVHHVEVSSPDEWHPPLVRPPELRQRDAACLLIRRVRVLPALAAVSNPPPHHALAALSSDVNGDGEGGEKEAEEEEDEGFSAEAGQGRWIHFRAERERACWEEKGLLDMLGLHVASGMSISEADASKNVRLDVVQGLIAITSAGRVQQGRGQGESLVVQALRAAARDLDAEVRRAAISGYAKLAPHADEDVIALLGTVVDEGMDDSYLRLTRVEHTTNDIGAVQEAAVEALTLHATQGRVRLLASPASACASVLTERLKEERHNHYLLANFEIDINLELERTSLNQDSGWQEKMQVLLERRNLVRKERVAVAEAIRSLNASLRRTHAAMSAKRAEAFALRLWLARNTQRRARWLHALSAGALSADPNALVDGDHGIPLQVLEDGEEDAESVWRVPLVVPEEAAENGAVSWTLRSFPYLETLAPSVHMIEGGAAAHAELCCLWSATHGGGRPYVPLFASCATWRPPLALGEGGSLAAGVVIEGEVVHTSLWAIPFLLPSPAPIADTAIFPGSNPAGQEDVGKKQGQGERPGAYSIVDSGAVWEGVGRVGFSQHRGLRLFFNMYPPGTSADTVRAELTGDLGARDKKGKRLAKAMRADGLAKRVALEDKIAVVRLPLHPPLVDSVLIGELLHQASEQGVRALLLVATSPGPLPHSLPMQRPTMALEILKVSFLVPL